MAFRRRPNYEDSNQQMAYQDAYQSGVEDGGLAGMDEMPMHPITLASQDPNVIKWQLQIKEYLARFQHFLMGHVYDPISDTWDTEDTIPVVNKSGMQDLISFVSNELDKTITLSNLSIEDVYRMAKEARKTITEVIYLKWQYWGLSKNGGAADLAKSIALVVEIDHIIFSNLKRAYMEGERRYHKAIQSFKEIISTQRPSQKQSKEFWS